ncbi:MAG: 50S ribosomal protein L29 [Nitrospinota bacterium]|nr:MAG: 50S ribosomal protein L29 [Nitrospinota bacterium]
MKASELRGLSVEELREKERELQRELFNLRFQLATGQIEDVNRIRIVRKDIARVKTLLREQELGIVPRPKKRKEEE